MGIGDYPCGNGPCGHDPVAAPSARVVGTSAIPYYDPTVRGFKVDTNGDLVSVHPVIQEAAFALGVELGSIPATPRLGLDRRRILKARREDVQRTAEDAVSVALKRLLDRGDIAVVRVVTERQYGRVAMDVEIVNLRDPSRRVVPIRGVF